MLQVECEKCKQRFWVKGYTTPDTWEEPGEVCTDLESDDDLCEHLDNGEAFTVVDDSHREFPDDMC